MGQGSPWRGETSIQLPLHPQICGEAALLGHLSFWPVFWVILISHEGGVSCKLPPGKALLIVLSPGKVAKLLFFEYLQCDLRVLRTLGLGKEDPCLLRSFHQVSLFCYFPGFKKGSKSSPFHTLGARMVPSVGHTWELVVIVTARRAQPKNAWVKLSTPSEGGVREVTSLLVLKGRATRGCRYCAWQCWSLTDGTFAGSKWTKQAFFFFQIWGMCERWECQARKEWPLTVPLALPPGQPRPLPGHSPIGCQFVNNSDWGALSVGLCWRRGDWGARGGGSAPGRLFISDEEFCWQLGQVAAGKTQMR